MDSIEKLSQLFEKFPGIGPRQARRFVQYLLGAHPAVRAELAEMVKRLGVEVAQCKKCFRWFPLKEKDVTAVACDICEDTRRDASVLFVVEKDADIDNVERSGFKGRYFVLGGTIPLAAEDPERHVRLKQLSDHVSRSEASREIKEVILGLSATTEGDHTRLLLQEKLKDSGLKLSSLGRGLSTGSELEYADPDTIHEALANRS